jgi:hypothetical protein
VKKAGWITLGQRVNSGPQLPQYAALTAVKHLLGCVLLPVLKQAHGGHGGGPGGGSSSGSTSEGKRTPAMKKML